MGVLVVHIRRMRVGMRCRRMAVPMAVTACGHDRMRVDMVPVVVDVGMFMFQRLVAVLVSVVFGQMQCHTHKHQKATEHHQPSCSALSQAPRRQRPHEGRKRENRARTGRTKGPLGQQIKPQAQAIACCTDGKQSQHRCKRRQRLTE